MKRYHVAVLLAGVAGAFATEVVADQGKSVLELGPLRFDPYLAALSAFVLLAVWGFVGALGVHERLASEWFTPEETLIVLVFGLGSGITTSVQTDLAGVSFAATVLSTLILTAGVLGGGLLLRKRLGGEPIGSEARA